MTFFKKRVVFFALVLAGIVSAGHIKRHHPHHRSQCRPRLTPTTSPSNTSTASHVHTSNYPLTNSQAHPTSSRSVRPTTTVHDVVPSPPSHSPTQSPQVVTVALTPNGIKAGIAGGDAYPFMKDHIGWWYDWSPTPSKPGKPIAVPMLWGNGTADKQDAERLKAFEQISTAPHYVLGFEEPDCVSGSGSAGMSVEDGVAKWESLIAPYRAKGTKLGSPSMCKQADETWLAEFEALVKTPWDITAIHINKNNMDGVKKDIDHYMKYGKPIWVTEFACVDDFPGFTPCANQDEINTFIRDIVRYFEGNSNIWAYAYSNGLGLGRTWPLMNGDSLSESGQTYLQAISEYS